MGSNPTYFTNKNQIMSKVDMIRAIEALNRTLELTNSVGVRIEVNLKLEQLIKLL